MKIVVQNGVEHILSRKDVESILRFVPKGLANKLNQIVLCQGEKDSLYATYHDKEGIVGFYCPMEHSNLTKGEALDSLMSTLLCINERGSLPQKLSVTAQQDYLANAQSIFKAGGLINANKNT